MKSLPWAVGRRPGALIGYVLTLAAAVGAGALAANYSAELRSWVLIASPLVIWLAARRSLNWPLLSPVTLTAGVIWGIGAGGYLLRRQIAESQSGGVSIRILLPEARAYLTLVLVMTFVGILVATAGLIRRAERADGAPRLAELTWAESHPPRWAIAAASLPLLVLIVDNGSDLVERGYYLIGEAGTVLGGLGGPIVTAAVVVVGYIFGSSPKGRRVLPGLVFVAYLVMLFTWGSRRFALAPVLFALGAFLAANTSGRRRGVLVGAVATALLLPLPLAFRGLDSHGLLPYAQALIGLSPLELDWFGALSNVLVAFPIIGETAFGRGEVSASDLQIILNPLPGNIAGWYEIAPRFFLNRFTPYAGIGELANVGWLAVIAGAVAIGAALAWVEKAVAAHITAGRQILAAMILGLTGLFALQMMQYTLRSSIRILLYVAALELGVRFALLVGQSVRSTRHGRPTLGAKGVRPSLGGPTS